MIPGLYVLASLCGAPLDPADVLSLSIQTSTGSASYADPDFAVMAADTDNAAIHIQQIGETVLAFAGYLDEPEDLARSLGLVAQAPVLALAAGALERYGAEACAYMLGEWSFLRWHAPSRELTLLTSQALRDPMFFAASQGYVAVAPSAFTLGSLPWVGRRLDRDGLALSVSRAGLRHIRTAETMWKGISTVAPASREVFTQANGRKTTASPTPSPPSLWQDSFQDAIDALDSMGRRIMRQHMTRHPQSAFLISGGLDSTLLTAWGAMERGVGREMVCLSSMAMPGSSMPDEREFSTAAATMLDVPITGVWPMPEDNLFRPPSTLHHRLNSPVGGQFPVYERFAWQALAEGATAIFHGNAGEMHVSNTYRRPETSSHARALVRRLRSSYRLWRSSYGWPVNAFHVRLAPALLEQLPTHWAQVWRKGPPRENDYPAGDPPMGIHVMAQKQASASTADRDGLRHLSPYRDQRLQRLAAGMPISFISHGGLTRALARTMLMGRVPEAVWARHRGRPFFPDYVPLLKSQAPSVVERLPLYRRVGIGDWVNLGWLPGALKTLATSAGTTDYLMYYQVQHTVLMAEFLLWASAEGIDLNG